MKSILHLNTGHKFIGKSFGKEIKEEEFGEIVFQTGMVGYPESLTDPSYLNQILVLTYPLIGNYGIPSDSLDEFNIKKYLESNNIQVDGLIVSENTDGNNHWESVRNLNTWMIQNKVPGISNIDTRDLTIKLRSKGTILGRIYRETALEIPDFIDYNSLDLVKEVSRKEIQIINQVFSKNSN